MNYASVWVLDFEYRAPTGENPTPVCLCATDVLSGRRLQLWEREMAICPFDCGPDTLFCAFYASAEISCFLQLGWPIPVRILDLFTEFRVLTNGRHPVSGNSLLGAMVHYGLGHIALEQKAAMRDRIQAGPPWSRKDRDDILAYCWTDVDATAELLQVMLPQVAVSEQRFGQALLRGRAMVGIAGMEHVGIPIDVPMLQALRTYWDALKALLIDDVDAALGVYEDGHFREAKFLKLVEQRGYPWPRHRTGRLVLDKETFRAMGLLYPELEPLRQLRNTLGELHLHDLAVGADGRNRVMLSPFRAKTGRNQPSSSKFVFGPATWARSLIKPPPGRAVAYIDWSCQEIAIAAAISGDPRLLAAVASGDPYIAFARSAGLAPPDATKASHGAIRDRVKSCVLGINYGMGEHTLAHRLGVSRPEARLLLQLFNEAYPRFAKWREDHLNRSLIGIPPTTSFGWNFWPDAETRPTTLKNFPIQSTGAEMLRLACCLGAERGIDICCPVHDAVLIEADIDSIETAAKTIQEAMAEASRLLLNGLEVRTDVKITRWPDRYEDPRGADMFGRIVALLRRLASETDKIQPKADDTTI